MNTIYLVSLVDDQGHETPVLAAANRLTAVELAERIGGKVTKILFADETE